MKRLHGKSFVAVLLFASVLAVAKGQSAPDPLKTGFENPPDSARPRVWWHWMNGNISKEGIKLDLEWMRRAGIAGFQNFDAALETPQVVDHRLAYMTPEWKDAFKYAIQVGDHLGMEMAIAGSPGWSESGGPWVPPSQGMKKYVWSESLVEGGKPFSGILAHPPTKTGAFQTTGVRDLMTPPEGTRIPEFYADARVFAYKKPAALISKDVLYPKITSSGGTLNAALLSDGDLEKTTTIPIPAKEGESSWIQFEFPEPQTIRAVTFATRDPGTELTLLWNQAVPKKTLEASDDGQNFRAVSELANSQAAEQTISFAPVTARYFRVVFKRVPLPPLTAWWLIGVEKENLPAFLGSQPPPAPESYEIGELVLHADARVNHFEEKAAFAPVADLYSAATPEIGAGEAIAKSEVIDLTSKMAPDGTLTWTPLTGQWVIVRLGYSLLGITNHPATAEATGLEVDKLDHRYVKDYFEKYLDSYKQTVGADRMGKRGLRYVVNDSWEAARKIGPTT